MSALWRSRLTSLNIFQFLLLGMISTAVFFPVGRWIHLMGHGVFASLTSCSWIGIQLSVFDHGAILLNYPDFIYPNTYAALWYWTGGFLFLSLAQVVLFSFPFPSHFISQLITRLACLHILVAAGIIPAVESLKDGDLYMTSFILSIPLFIISGLILLSFAVLFVVLHHLLVKLPGGSIPMRPIGRTVFVFSIWTLPVLLYCTAGFFLLNGSGVGFITGAITAVFPAIIAPFLPQGYTISTVPRFKPACAVLFTCALAIHFLVIWAFPDSGSGTRAVLWSEPSATHNIPVSMQTWRLGQ